MKTSKRIISFLLTIVMTLSIVPIAAVQSSAASVSKEQAVSWANAQIGKSLDQDGVYGAQCVDLIRYYYSYLGASPVSGNGCDYAKNALPAGWSRIQYYNGFVPQPGDIAVWTYASSAYGHVAIVTSADSSKMNVVEQNGSTHVTRAHSYSYSYGTFYGVIRPNFAPTYTTAPTPPKISINKNLVEVNEVFNLSWTKCDNAMTYWISCWSETEQVITREGHNFSESISISQPGKYAIAVVSINSAGESISNWCQFSVYDNTNGYNTFQYDANGGTGNMADQRVYYNSSFTLSKSVFQKTGYTQQGWHAFRVSDSTWHVAYIGWKSEQDIQSNRWEKQVYADSFSGPYDESWHENGVLNDKIILYAVWKANTYTVTYNANGGTGTTANSSHTYDTAKALTANGFTRAGYTFLGWSTSASAATATYTNRQSVKNLTATNGATVTLYAVWQKNPATVSSISIQSKPTKTVYTVGEKFDASGLSVKVTMSDGTTKTITSGFTLSNPDMTVAGTKTVTVTYSGKTASFTITVKAAEPSVNAGALRLITPASARIGQTVQIPVQLDKASLGTLTFTVTYDRTKLKYVSCTESAFDMCDAYAGNAGVVKLACIDNTAVSAGRIAVLTFEVIAPAACLTDLTVAIEEAYDGSDKAVSLAGGTWNLSVVKTWLGDVNGDGKITAIDARWALQAASGARMLTEEQKAAADANGDGKITAIDARWILQAASGSRVL